MYRVFPLFTFLLLVPLEVFSQFTLIGKVVNAADGKALSDASVFMNNTTIGAKTTADGTFVLRRLTEGHYNLIISAVGFERQSLELFLDQNTQRADIRMQPKTLELKEVAISGRDPNRARKLRLFREEFLGSVFGLKCRILNPEVLTLKFSRHQNVLTASADEYLEIENKALGYKIRYYLENFFLDRQAMKIAYEGFAYFEGMQGTSKDKNLWERNRQLAYNGSPKHFLRSILSNKVDSAFMVRPFCAKKIFNAKVIDYRTGDSVTRTFLIYDTLRTNNYVHRTDKRGIYSITYPSDIDIFYYPPGEPHSQTGVGGIEYGNRGQVGSIDFMDEPLFFDVNGIILNPTAVSFRYSWATSRIGELLPEDYWPVLTKE